MTSPYASVGPRLVELGYSAIPIASKSKFPGIWCGNYYRALPGWSQFCTRLPSKAEVVEWVTWPDAGVGVATGPASSVVALDFDTRSEFWPAVEAVIETSPVIKRGIKGYTAFYRYSGEPTKQFTIPGDDVPAIELLSVGRQSVIPPSVHPEMKGQCYQWDDASLCDVRADQLPRLPHNIVELLYQILGIEQRVLSTRVVADADGLNPSVEMAEAMVPFVPAEVGAAEWIRMGASLKSGFPDEVAFDLWNLWSSRDKREWRKGIPQYQPSRMYRRWQGITGDGVTIGTFIKAAENGGFNDWHFDEDRALAHISPVLNPRKVAPVKPETVIVEVSEPPKFIEEARITIPAELVASVPGLVGEIADWITSTAIKPQPVLSLGAALAFVGALKGKRVRNGRARSNLYVLGLGGSGSGKNHPLTALQYLNALLYTNYDTSLVGDKPVSEAGLYAAVKDRSGRCVIVWDEIGHAISAMSKKNAAPHYAAIASTMTELFSCADRSTSGQRLAKEQREPIVQPCLCVYGTTVPERFYESLTEESVTDGFLGRWLIFETHDNWPEENEDTELRPPPARVMDQLRRIEDARPIRSGSTKSLDTDTPPNIDITPTAAALLREACDRFRTLGMRAEAEGSKLHMAIWVRAAEHLKKLSLVVAGDEIAEEDVRWARELVEVQCRNAIQLIEHRIAQNEQERLTKRILRFVREAGAKGVTKSRLTKLTFDMKKRERDEILDSLEEANVVSKESVSDADEKGSGRRATIYRLTNSR